MAKTQQELVLDTLARWSTRWPGGRTVTIIDIDSPDDALIEALNSSALPLRAERLQVRPAEAVEALGDRSFGYAHVGNDLARRNDVERLTTLRVAERLGKHGLVWTGTVRPPLSTSKDLSRSDVLDIRKRLGMGWCTPRVPRLGGEFIVAGEHADAWTGLGDVVTD